VSRRRGKPPDAERPAESEFARALDGVRPLAGPERLPPPPPGGGARPRASDREPRRFVVEASGGAFAGRAADVSRAILRRLRQGEPPPELELDLHGLGAREARAALLRATGDAQSRGLRCLLVIHGRGARSASGAVLREALPDWLQAAPQAERVLAFASAPRSLGGPGATLVLLRRTRAVSSAAPLLRGEPDER
jgi:DNA-nicking Smr family endonuclease